MRDLLKIKRKKITVLLSVFNSEDVLANAIESVLSQTYTSWNMIIINDGSTDSTQDVIDYYVNKFQNIYSLSNEKNYGLAYSLNQGLKYSNSEYIARMDADDISLPKRLEIQMSFMEKNPKIDVLGSGALVKNNNSSLEVFKPLTHREISKKIYKFNPFFHSSILMKKKFIDEVEGYKQSLIKAQDYDLWLRGYKKFNYANLDMILIHYNERIQPPMALIYGFKVRFSNAVRDKRVLQGLFWSIISLTYGFHRIVKMKIESKFN